MKAFRCTFPENCPAEGDKKTISQVIDFGSISSADWNGDTKAVCEVGYGIALKIFDPNTKKWKDGVSTSSEVHESVWA